MLRHFSIIYALRVLDHLFYNELYTTQCTQKGLTVKNHGEAIGRVTKCIYGIHGLICFIYYSTAIVYF